MTRRADVLRFGPFLLGLCLGAAAPCLLVSALG